VGLPLGLRDRECRPADTNGVQVLDARRPRCAGRAGHAASDFRHPQDRELHVSRRLHLLSHLPLARRADLHGIALLRRVEDEVLRGSGSAAQRFPE